MNGVVILGLGDELYQRMAFNLCVSIKMSDPRIDITLVYNSELRLNTYEKNYFNKLIFTNKHKYDVIYSIRDLVTYDNILLIESNYLFFNNKQITWLFSEFKKDMYLDFTNGVKPSNKIIDTEFKGTIWRDYNDFNFFFIKRTATIWNAIDELILKYNTSFDTACKIALNNLEANKLELILETDINDSLSNIYKKYYGISISLNYKKGIRYEIFNTLLTFYQSKITKIQEFSNQQLINPYNWSYKPIILQKSTGLNLLIQYYSTDEKRDKEILYCINRNLELPLIKTVVVFVESGELLINHPKLIKIPHSRPKYKDLIHWCNLNLQGELCAISNSDIYFDQTLNHLFNHSIENKFIALTRYNVHADGNISFYNNKRSNDVWIFQAPITEFGDFYTGIPHCDGRIVYEADANGLVVTNPSKLIYSYHLHNEALRSWTWEFDYIYGEVLDLDWTNDINSISNKTKAFVDYQIPHCDIDSDMLFNLYKNLNVSKGVWVEVGIGDGKSFASCMASAGWRGVLIEANKNQYDHCVKKYKLYDNIKVLHNTISNTDTVQTLYNNNNFTSLNIKYLNQNGYTYSQVSTMCKKLSTVFIENFINTVDILIVDTNGTESDVISSIDFNTTHIKKIIVKLKSDDNKLNQDNYRGVNSILSDNYTIVYSNASYVIYSYDDKANTIPTTIYLEDNRISEFLKLQLNDENIFKNWLSTIDYTIDLSNQVVFDVHRSGWKWVISELSRYLKPSNNKNFIGYIDDLIIYNNKTLNEYTNPFTAIVHYTKTTPPWLTDSHTIDNVLSNAIFKAGNCKSLYALSSSNAEYINDTYVSCDFLYHPAQECDNLWTPEKFNSNTDKKVILLGYYLRRYHSIYGLTTNYKKYIMHLYDWRKDHYNSDINWAKSNGYVINSSVNFFNKVHTNAEYDKLLSENIIFLDLWDSGANNSLIECIIRNTPVLIRKSQATIDYLGPKYPFYFDTIEEANIKINDADLIIQTYNYLKNLDKTHLDIKFFIYNLVKSYKKKNTISTVNRATIPIESAYELFMPTDTVDSSGGIYNPGYVYYKGKNVFLPRIEQYTEIERGVNELWYRTAAIPYIIETNDTFDIIKKTKLQLINFPKGRIEDFRLFIHNNQIWSNFIYVETHRNIYPCLALIDLNTYTMEFKGKIKLNITTTPVEKNWVFFSSNELYMIYSVNPFRIFKIDLNTLTGVQVFNKQNALPWNIGYISSSTNPIKFKDDKFIMGIHTRDKSITYHQGFIIFDMNFNITYCSSKPYFSKGDTDGINKGVFYTSSIGIKNDTIYCFAGDGDWKSVVLEIKINNIK